MNDFAEIFTSEQRDVLENTLSNFEKETSNSISVVTVAELDGETIENFSVKLFEEWKIGEKGKDNGLLLLIALKEKQVRIEVGYGLEGVITDARSHHIIETIIKPAFQTQNYYDGTQKAVSEIMASLRGEIHETSSQTQATIKDSLGALFVVGFFIILGIISLALTLAKSRSYWAGGCIGFVAGTFIGIFFWSTLFSLLFGLVLGIIGIVVDYFLSRNASTSTASLKKKMTHQEPDDWWNSGSGRFGSGGGGFGGFGGGRSGGGGASGSW